MQTPETIRDIQRLTGRLAELRRLISKLVERCLPFFDTLKGDAKSSAIIWKEECQRAFEELKHYISSPSLLAVAPPMEPPSLYLSASDRAVGAVLVREMEGTQRPVYYVSNVLKDAETRYPNV